MSLRLIKRGSTFNTDSHDKLINRDTSDQHPINAITGLKTELDRKYEKPTTGIPYSDLEREPATKVDFDTFKQSSDSSILDVIKRINEQTSKIQVAEDAVADMKVIVKDAGDDVEYLKHKIERLTSGDIIPGASTLIGDFLPLSYRSTLTYDGDKLVKEVVHGDIEKEITYEYNQYGMISRKNVTIDGFTRYADYVYDSHNRLITVNTNGAEETNVYGVVGGAVPYNLTLEYNHPMGYVTKMIYTGQINKTVEISYDDTGNIIGRKAVYPNGSVRVATYTYDANGNMVSTMDDGVDELYPISTAASNTYSVKQVGVYGVTATQSMPHTEIINTTYGIKCDVPKVNVLLDDRHSVTKDTEFVNSTYLPETPIMKSPKLSFKSYGTFNKPEIAEFDKKDTLYVTNEVKLTDAFDNGLEIKDIKADAYCNIFGDKWLTENSIGEYEVYVNAGGTVQSNGYLIFNGQYIGKKASAWTIRISRKDKAAFLISKVELIVNNPSTATSSRLRTYANSNFTGSITTISNSGNLANSAAASVTLSNTLARTNYDISLSNYNNNSYEPFYIKLYTESTSHYLLISDSTIELYDVENGDIVSYGGDLTPTNINKGFALSALTGGIARKAYAMGLNLITCNYRGTDVVHTYTYAPHPQIRCTPRVYIGDNKGALDVSMDYTVDTTLPSQVQQDYIRIAFRRDGGDWCNLFGDVIDISDAVAFESLGIPPTIRDGGITDIDIKNFFDGVDYIEAAIMMWPAKNNEKMSVRSLKITFTEEEFFKECVHGADYDIAYQNNNRMVITFYKSGDYRVNYYSM